MDFMNDYYFLEEATRFTKEIVCNKNVKNQARLNIRFLNLRREAHKRNIKFYFMNNGLVKRKRNTSFYKSQEQTIYWLVELIFPNAGNIVLRKKFNENTKVQEIVSAMLDLESDPQRAKQLDFYKAEGINKLRVFLKAEGLKKSFIRFFEMNVKKSLKSNLSGKTIIEYPTLHIVLNHSADNYDLITSDDETVQSEMKSFSRTLQEEVFSKKVGVNPPVGIVQPEEVPIISELISGSDKGQCMIESSRESQNNSRNGFVAPNKKDQHDSDDEVHPENYFFTND